MNNLRFKHDTSSKDYPTSDTAVRTGAVEMMTRQQHALNYTCNPRTWYLESKALIQVETEIFKLLIRPLLICADFYKASHVRQFQFTSLN